MGDKEKDLEYVNLISTFNSGVIAIIKSIFDSEGIDYFLQG